MNLKMKRDVLVASWQRTELDADEIARGVPPDVARAPRVVVVDDIIWS
jgi:hypothetical protein